MTQVTAVRRGSQPTRRRQRVPWGMRLAPYLFLLPNMAIFAVFTIYPALSGVNISLYKSSNGRTFTPVGTANYERILSDSQFWEVARQTAIYAVAYVVVSLLLATALAILVNQQARGQAFFRAAIFIPVLVSPVVVGLVFNWILQRNNGLVNNILSALGAEPVPFLVDGGWAMVSIVGVGVWTQLGFYMLILLAGLQAIDPTLYEAASMDSAGPFQHLWRITLPLLKPSMLVVLILGTIHGFQAFDFIWTLTGGGPAGATTLMVQYIYENGFVSPIRYGTAAAGGVILFLCVFTLTLVNWFLTSRKEEA